MRRRAVAFAPEARSNLLRLGDWIAERAGADVALNYIGRLETYCAGFETAGERGQRRDDIRAGLRIVGFERRVAIAFAVSNTEVTILRFYYGGRNWTDV
ncbi:MAG: plasmid stabilization protein [Alphaproteobacteria bacterium RIFCSPHIGHO2_12_FULL_66_14]|nr:MAG: plasmid stabilization protein [Alphaproteobacteria bacterium RIFCSPHIGHO2_12_FULL_66_14]